MQSFDHGVVNFSQHIVMNLMVYFCAISKFLKVVLICGHYEQKSILIFHHRTNFRDLLDVCQGNHSDANLTKIKRR